MKMRHKLFCLALALILLLALAACGSKTQSASDSVSTGETAVGAPEAVTGDKSNSGVASTGTSGTATGTNITELPTSDKIIYSGNTTLETTEFDNTIEALAKMVSDIGGFVQSSSVTGSDFYTEHSGVTTYRSAQYVFRIPADKFKSFTESLSTLGNVPYSSTNAENITMQYSDTESRLTASRTKEARLLELLAKASSMEDILAIENSLSDVRYEIESLTSQLKNWDSLISYSTLSLNVNEVALYTETGTGTLSYGQQLKEAFIRSVKELGRFFKGLFKFLVAAVPALVVLAVIAVPVFFIVRASHRKKKARLQKGADNTDLPPRQ